jgi:uncharacterized protein (DUF1684 family)
MGAIALLDWRRKVADMYGAVRANPDPAAAHAIWQRSRNQLLATHSESPVPQAERPTFTGVPVAPYNPRLRFTARVDTGVERLRIEVRTGTDGLVSFERAGVVHLPDVGDLDVWWLASYGGGVFVPIRDTRTDGATYAGGRYVIDTVKGADLGGDGGYLVVDLNFAYNPSCAYDPAWACPLAPPGNVVPVAIDAGELMPTEKQGSSQPA